MENLNFSTGSSPNQEKAPQDATEPALLLFLMSQKKSIFKKSLLCMDPSNWGLGYYTIALQNVME